MTLATVLGVAGQKMRQPLIIMFLVTGILAGPSGLGIIGSYEQIELLAHIGIALLLSWAPWATAAAPHFWPA